MSEEIENTEPATGGEVEQIKLIGIEESQLAYLLDTIKEYQAKEDKIAECCFKAMNVFGLIDPKTGDVIDELKSGDGVVGIIFSKLKDQISISDMMFNKKKVEADMQEKFGFFKDLLPIFQDYAERKRAQQRQQHNSKQISGT